LRKSCATPDTPRTQTGCQWEVVFDFQKVLPGESVDLLIEDVATGQFLQHNETTTTVPFPVHTDAAELTVWILLPEGKEYRSFRVLRDNKGKFEDVDIASEYLADDFTILAFRLLAVKGNSTYEIQWHYK
jgi:hypothetical protein